METQFDDSIWFIPLCLLLGHAEVDMVLGTLAIGTMGERLFAIFLYQKLSFSDVFLESIPLLS